MRSAATSNGKSRPSMRRSSLRICQPKRERTGSAAIWPGSRRMRAASTSATRSPGRSCPSEPPTAPDGQSECSRASCAKAPVPARQGVRQPDGRQPGDLDVGLGGGDRLDQDVGRFIERRAAELGALGVVDAPAFGLAGSGGFHLGVQDRADEGRLGGLLAAVLVEFGVGRQAQLGGAAQQQGLGRQGVAGGGARLGRRQAGMVLDFLGQQALGDLDPVDDDRAHRSTPPPSAWIVPTDARRRGSGCRQGRRPAAWAASPAWCAPAASRAGSGTRSGPRACAPAG